MKDRILKGRLGRKLIIAVSAASLLICLASCGSPSGEEETALPSDIEIYDGWPQNEYTEDVPAPNGGEITVSKLMEVNGEPWLYVEMEEFSRDQVHDYIAQLQVQGFEKIGHGENDASGGTLLGQGEKYVSIAYSGESCIISIKIMESQMPSIEE